MPRTLAERILTPDEAINELAKSYFGLEITDEDSNLRVGLTREDLTFWREGTVYIIGPSGQESLSTYLNLCQGPKGRVTETRVTEIGTRNGIVGLTLRGSNPKEEIHYLIHHAAQTMPPNVDYKEINLGDAYEEVHLGFIFNNIPRTKRLG